MILIHFSDAETEGRALGYLAGRFSFKTWDTGQTMVPEQALPCLAREGFKYFVEGPVTYEQLAASLRNPAAATIQ